MNIENENASYKVDASGRVVIPAGLRKKYGIAAGDVVDYYVINDGKETYIAFKKKEEICD